MPEITPVGGISCKSEGESYADDNVAAAYRVSRPNYPEEIIQKFVGKFYEERQTQSGSPIKCAIDVGCGPGQLTSQLSKHCQRVIGVDISAAQIAEAEKGRTEENIEYRVGDCYNLGVDSGSVDLITVATALHRFEDIPRFVKEVDRCLRPGGVFAFFGQWEDNTEDVPNKILWKYTYGEEWFNPYWTATLNRLLVDHYRTVELPYPVTERFQHSYKVPFTIEKAKNLMLSFEAYKNLYEINPEKAQRAVELFCAELEAGVNPDGKECSPHFGIEYKMVGVICSKPV